MKAWDCKHRNGKWCNKFNRYGGYCGEYNQFGKTCYERRNTINETIRNKKKRN